MSENTLKEMPIFNALFEMVAKITRETRKEPTEYKLHPNDWRVLKMEVKPHMVVLSPNGPPKVCGLRILLDYSAERLPTKVPNVQIEGLRAFAQSLSNAGLEPRP